MDTVYIRLNAIAAHASDLYSMFRSKHYSAAVLNTPYKYHQYDKQNAVEGKWKLKK